MSLTSSATIPTTASWQRLQTPLLQQKNIELWVKHLKTCLPQVSGNKWLKLKYHIDWAQKKHKKGFITFGGAFSNHLAAISAISHYHKLHCIAFIRADFLDVNNPTIKQCLTEGTNFKLLNRSEYRKRNEPAFIESLIKQYPDYLIVPEGGSSIAGALGVSEFNLEDTPLGKADYITCATASGGTLSGIINNTDQKVLGIAVVKDASLQNRVIELVSNNKQNWSINTAYCAGGYAKFNDHILNFCKEMATYNLALEPIYTGKALYAITKLIEQDYFPSGSRISFFHTGGLQGLAGLHYLDKISDEDFTLFRDSIYD